MFEIIKIILMIIGAIVASIVVLLIAAYLVFQLLIRAAVSKMEVSFRDMLAAIDSFPKFRIKLEPVARSVVRWHNPEQGEEAVGTLKELGFKEVGRFFHSDQSTVEMMGFAHPVARFYAVLYDHREAGVWVEFACQYDQESKGAGPASKGGHVTVFTNAADLGLTTSPYTTVRRFAEDNVQQLWVRVKQFSPAHELRMTPVTGFIRWYESMHDRRMDWRVESGGYKFDEYVRFIQASAAVEGSQDGEGPTSMDLGARREEYQAVQAELEKDVDLELRRLFLEETTMTALKWDGISKRVVIVHNMSDVRELAGELMRLKGEMEFPEEGIGPRVRDKAIRLEEGAFEELEDYLKLFKPVQDEGADNMVDQFEVALQIVPGAEYVIRLGQYTDPVHHGIYVMPRSPEDVEDMDEDDD